MAWKDYPTWQQLTIVASASITTSYVAAVTLSSPAASIFIKNGTNGDVLVGIDGSTAKWGFPASSGAAYDICTNSPKNNQLLQNEGTTLYVKWNGSAPMSPTGNLYIEIMEVTP